MTDRIDLPLDPPEPRDRIEPTDPRDGDEWPASNDDCDDRPAPAAEEGPYDEASQWWHAAAVTPNAERSTR